MSLRIACIGRNGQTAQALAAKAAGDASVELIRGGREALDLGDPASLVRFIDATKPDAVINTGAYNAVDRAETEPDEAMRVNVDGPAALARHCRRLGLPFIHMSTDQVFDGTSETPYVEADAPNPLSTYGRSKLAGENAVLAEDNTALVTRVCWLFSEFADNFVVRMIALARTRPTLRIVSDQIGPPTHTSDIAAALMSAMRLRQGEPARLSGLLHLAAQGMTSRAEMALAIMQASSAQGGPVATIEPVTTAEFGAGARRPLRAHMSSAKADAVLGLHWRAWREAIPPVVASILARPVGSP